MTFDLIDVFGAQPMKGNQLGVVHGADYLSNAQMLALTQWLGFSETTFLMRPNDPDADYRVRIFYPAGELPFAGHPTLGSCHAWLDAGGIAKRADAVVQECGVGLVEVRQDHGTLAFKAPDFTRTGPLNATERTQAAQVVGVAEGQIIEALHIANGPNWQMLRLGSVAEVLAAQPAAKAPEGTNVGLVAAYPDGSPLEWELRAFFSKQRGELVEDPVTGSFNAGVAMQLFASGLAKGSYLAGQGQNVGADGRIHWLQDADGAVWIGGRSVTIARGAALPVFGQR